ncbi:WD40/YVTN/BNR-like repeat-containing protein [Flavihumibacter cheonanensis]|uniref:WD40/YVTN/BNR-like repeat-containing protein n=1 Tax=Flavihumibacter cheonanensis TaxID=1442385 RepID=UPI001EF86C83|nr:YCF48-related protein [Flavihumibacter cheonanensis]MCG7751403.1 YCF48-related protein [Flavihumibacter cheonanensis]
MRKIAFQLICMLSLVLLLQDVVAQKIQDLPGREGVSFRGLSVVNDRLLWVSGNKGTVGRSTDGGKSFQWMTVKGHEKRDFRDIEAFDAVTAVILAVDSPGLILRTFDGGESWQEVYRDNRSGIFLDALHFRNKDEGMAVGDPIDGKILLLRTADGGRSWQPYPNTYPAPIEGEAFFAASGGNMVTLKKAETIFVSGGKQSRVFYAGQAFELPLKQGETSTGANAIALKYPNRKRGGRHWVVVGGDFGKDKEKDGNFCFTQDGGASWQQATAPPQGYRSGISYVRGNQLIACGTSGVDWSRDGGRNWTLFSSVGYHVVQKAKDGKAVYLAGGNGRIGKLVR